MASEPVTAVDRRDVGLACACGALALVAYVRTLAPGLTADVDSPLFQFLGRVLGVAHNPGYPLYSLVTWPVAQLPFGSLAWRINLFSAVMGAVAVGLTAIAARRLGCRRLVAAVAALGLAAGGTFWSQAVVAEVYTLHVALVVALLQAALAWRVSRRPRDFYLAVACLAAGLGHHTTIAAFAPALALQALVADRRFALRPRTIATSAAIVVAGLLSYAFVLVRSRDPQAYVESRATTLGDLAGVVLGGQFRDRLFSESWTTIVAERVPLLVAHVFRPDLTIAGLTLALVGAAWLLRRRLPDALLLLTGAAIVTGFAASYAVVDQPVFLLPVVLCLWLLAAAGLEQTLTAAARAMPILDGVTARIALGLGALALPVWIAAYHGPRVDRSDDRDDGRHVEALIAALPGRAAIVSSDFITDRMVLYELLGRDAAAGRDLRLAPRDAPSIAALAGTGVHIVALAGAAARLRLDGLDFSALPVHLADGTFDRFVAELPRGSIVALAIPAAHVRGFERTARAACRALGAPDGWASSVAAEHVAVGVVGRSPARIVSSPGTARLALPPGDAPWVGRTVVEVEAGHGEAVIRSGGRDLFHTADGVAIAIWSADGVLIRTLALAPADGYQVPLAPTTFTAYPLIGVADERAIGPGDEVDVTALADTGSLTVVVPAGATLALDAVDSGALAPRVVEERGGARVDVAPASADGIVRVSIAAPGEHAAQVFLTLGALPERLTARLASRTPGVARVRRVATAGLLRGPDHRSAVIRMTRDDQTRLVGAGWSAVEADDVGPYRWILARAARLVVPPSSPAWRRLTLDAFRAAGNGPSSVDVRVNGVALPAQPIHAGWRTYAWDLPPEAASALGRTSVEIAVRTDTIPPLRAFAVAALRLTDARAVRE